MAKASQNARKTNKKKDPPTEKQESAKFLVAQNLKKLAKKAEKTLAKRGRKRKQPAPKVSSKAKNADIDRTHQSLNRGLTPSDNYYMKIEELYKRMMSLGASPHARDKFSFEKLEESAIIEKKLWPLLVKSVIADHVNGIKFYEKEDKYQPKHAPLFAILINRRASNSNTSAGNSILEFINDYDYVSCCNSDQIEELETKFGKGKDGKIDQSALEKLAFEALLHDLFHSIEKSDTLANPTKKSIYDTISINIETEIIQFIIHCYASMDVSVNIQATMLRLTGLPIWEAMSPRRRVIELQNCPPLKLLWSRREKENSQSQTNVVEEHKDKEETGKKGTKRKKKNGNSEVKNERMKDSANGKDKIIKYESTFLPSIVSKFLATLNQIDEFYDEIKNEDFEEDETMTGTKFVFPSACVNFFHAALVLFIDLLSLPATRRYFQPYLLSTSFTVLCKLSNFFAANNLIEDTNLSSKIKLFQQLLDILIQVENFPMDNYSSKSLSNAEIQKQVHARCHALQQICFKHFIGSSDQMDDEDGVSQVINPKLLDFAYAGVAYACQEHFLKKHFGRLEIADLEKLAYILRLVEKSPNQNESFNLPSMCDEKRRSFLLSILVYRHAIRPSEAIALSQLPLYPAEDVLWDGNILPNGRSYGGNDENQILALPKLNTQFLTFGDYLLRSFKLMRLESAYGIRGDIVDAVRRSDPALHHDYSGENAEEDNYYGMDEDDDKKGKNNGEAHSTTFNGWARMAIEIMDFEITKVASPKLGETVPSKVSGEIKIDLEPLGAQIRKEWEEIGEFDNLFLVSIDAGKMTGGEAPSLNDKSDRKISDEEDVTFPSRYGIVSVRGCMVQEIKDESGTVLNDPTAFFEKKGNEDEEQEKPKGTKRFIKVALDPAQYARDSSNGQREKIYDVSD